MASNSLHRSCGASVRRRLIPLLFSPLSVFLLLLPSLRPILVEARFSNVQISRTLSSFSKRKNQTLILPAKQAQTPSPNARSSVAGRSWKAAAAGSVAGAVATAVLYPLDAAKTLRQASGATVASVPLALRLLIRQRTVYAGLGTALIGAMPSSALYFGAYETAKALQSRFLLIPEDAPAWMRCLGHGTAAAVGNLVSSAVFVPKEHLKQQMQFTGQRQVLVVLRRVLRESGLRHGLYRGYRATVLRNIPSAVVRFTLYEECRTRVPGFVAGAFAGAAASFLLTPLDVVKTKIATGTCPVDLQSCAQQVVQHGGVGALWTGAGARVLSSTLFSALGLGTFELTQRWLQEAFPEAEVEKEDRKTINRDRPRPKIRR
jgi:solute carrier family 25 (mitochondrial S-adenosylmethionine transporter), member 26